MTAPVPARACHVRGNASCVSIERLMKPRVSVLTIGVDDLDRALRFYRDGLGLPTDGIVGGDFEFGAVAFFPLQSGLQLALWPRKSIAHDYGLDVSAPSPTEVTIGHNVSSKADVDAGSRGETEIGTTSNSIKNLAAAQSLRWRDAEIPL